MKITLTTCDMDETVVTALAQSLGWSPTILVEWEPTDNPIDAPTFVANFASKKILDELINPFLIRQAQSALSDEYNAQMNAAEQAVREQTSELITCTIK